MTIHEQKAVELFKQGCNCAQAVFAAFSDLTGIDTVTSLKLSSSFGGGMGKLREVCGAVSGALMVLGCLYGYSDISDINLKAEHYERVRGLAGAFKEQYGTYICRELLNEINGPHSLEPTPRTDEFYRKRPCVKFIAAAARLADEYIENNPSAPRRNKLEEP